MANHWKNRCNLPLAGCADWLPVWLINGSLLCLLAAPAAACELPTWQARYNITKYGATIARLNMSLQTSNGRAQYILHTEPVGLLAAVSDEELTETSQLIQAKDTSWRLEKFSQQRAKDKQRGQRFTLVQTDNTLVASGEYDGKPFSLNPPPPAWDRASVQLALTCDLLADIKPGAAYTYTIVDNGSISTYHFEYRNQETVRIADAIFDAIKFERISGDRSTVFWLAPALQYMPVRIEQYKKGSLHLRMNLNIPAVEEP